MTRHPLAAFAIVALALLALLPCAAWAQDDDAAEQVNLAKGPKVNVGDQFRVTVTDTTETTISTGQGDEVQIAQQTAEEQKRTVVYEVLAVDRTGRPTRLRCTVVKAQLVAEVKAPTADKVEVTLGDLLGTARRGKDGFRFAFDTTTLVSGRMTKLTAPQIGLVKQILDDSMALPGFSEDRLLMPDAPVAVGATWKPSAEALLQWAQAKPESKRLAIKPKSAQFKLVSVTDGVAAISGTVKATAMASGMQLQITVQLTCKLDVRTGLWQAETVKGTVEGSGDQGTMKLVGTLVGAVQYRPGSGAATTLPEDLHDLGWQPAGKDTNSYRNAVAGVSLNLPKGYTQTPGKAGGPQVVSFVAKSGVQGNITLAELPLPSELAKISRAIVQGVKRVLTDFTVVSKESVSLPGNVPGELITATTQDGKVTMFILYALHGQRLVSVTVGAETEKDALVAEAKAIAMSLRAFDPDPTATAAAPPDEGDDAGGP